jgi:hypothetical protein
LKRKKKPTPGRKRDPANLIKPGEQRPVGHVEPHDPDGRSPEDRMEDEQTGFVLRLLSNSLTVREIEAACRQQYGIGHSRVTRLRARALEELRVAAEANRPYAKGEAIARLRGDLRTLAGAIASETAKPKGADPRVLASLISAKQTTEMRLADVEGTRAPDEVRVHHNVTGALLTVAANLTPEQLQAAFDRGMERRRKAAMFDAEQKLLVEAAKEPT